MDITAVVSAYPVEEVEIFKREGRCFIKNFCNFFCFDMLRNIVAEADNESVNHPLISERNKNRLSDFDCLFHFIRYQIAKSSRAQFRDVYENLRIFENLLCH